MRGTASSGNYSDSSASVYPEPQRIPAVAEQVMAIDKQAAELRDMASAIDSRFHKALRPTPPEAVSGKQGLTPGHPVPMANELAAISEVLSDVRRTLASVLDRAEL